MNIQDKMKTLVDKLNEWEYWYRIRNVSKVPDNVFDAKFKELKLLEEKYPEYILSDSPTQKVGNDLFKYSGKLHKHTQPMLSLDNVFSLEELKTWMYKTLTNNNLPIDTLFIAEPKYDGIAICLIYKGGNLSKAVTRGDGVYGEDITEAVHFIRNIPTTLLGDYPDYLEVRGEVYINKDTFKRINQERISSSQTPYAHPRNLASGTMKSLSPKLIKFRNLMFSPYGNTLDGNSYLVTKDKLINVLNVPKYITVEDKQNTDTFTCTYNTIDSIYESLVKNCKGLLSPTDGIVFKIDDISIQKQLGENNRVPRWAIAFKYPVESTLTYVRDIKVQVGRTGLLTPVAIIDPVVIDGVTVTNVTLHNFNYIENMGIGINAKVGVIRSGEVIPKIVEVFEEGDEYRFSGKCPSCGKDTYQHGENSYCGNYGIINPNVNEETSKQGLAAYHNPCREQVIQSLLYFVSKKCINIDGFGEELIRFYFDKGLIKNPIHFYHITKNELMKHPQVKDKLATKLLKNIEESKKITIDRFIVALEISSIGERKAKYFEGFKPILKEGDINAIYRFIDSIKNKIGSVSSLHVRVFFDDKSCLFYTKQLLECFNIIDNEVYEIPDNPLKDKTMVITGSISNKTRDELRELLERSLGVSIFGTVSNKTDIVLIGNNPSTSKVDKAKRLSIKMIDEADLLNIINDYI